MGTPHYQGWAHFVVFSKNKMVEVLSLEFFLRARPLRAQKELQYHPHFNIEKQRNGLPNTLPKKHSEL